MSLTDIETKYAGRRGAIFRLALVSGILTVLTLGFYRFWMKTRLRRYYWSAIRPGGTPLEYVGEPLEKLLGFLVAVVFMAFYIGVVNLVLMYFSFSLFQGNFVAYGLSFAGILPIIFFAQYRARRYVLARTRWRGIRFGQEPGAWGYTWRAALHWIITICTLGALWPRMSFWLEKYRVDHSYFGAQRLVQGGRWTMLLKAMKHVYLGLGVTAVALLVAVLGEIPWAFLVLFVSLPWSLFGLAYWRACSFRLLTNAKSIGEIGFRASPRSGRVFAIYMFGYALTFLSVALGALLVLAGAFLTVGEARLAEVADMLSTAGGASDIPTWMLSGLALALYFGAFIFWGVLGHVFVKMPLARHFTETIEIVNAHALSGIGQRARDEFAEAEGFADALDVGAAI